MLTLSTLNDYLPITMEEMMNIQSDTYSHSCPSYAGIVPYLVWPALLLALAGLASVLVHAGAALEATLTIAFLGGLGLLALYENRRPCRPDWQADRREWAANLAQFLPNGLLDSAGQMAAILIAIRFGAQENTLPLWLAVPLAIVISELFAYWTHRLGHTVPWLRRIHGIHHVPGKVNLVNTNTIHFLDMFGTALVSALPLVLLGFSREAMAIALFITGLQNFVVHVNADIRRGRAGRILMGPAHHRLHHSTRTEEAQNYGTTLALWDRVFGTYVPAHDRTPAQVGVADPGSFPPDRDLLASQPFPFNRQTGDVKREMRHTGADT